MQKVDLGENFQQLNRKFLYKIIYAKRMKYAYEFILFPTLYTGPKPPSPSLLSIEKLSVASLIVLKSNNGNSKFFSSAFSLI